MLFAGFKVADGRFTLFEVVAAGVLGNLVGSWIAYGIGYFGRVELLERHGKWLHITPKHLAWADRWFERYGDATVFFSRMIPVIRTFISLPGGRREDAVLALHRAELRSASSRGCSPSRSWASGRRQLGQPAGEAPLRRLRDRRG